MSVQLQLYLNITDKPHGYYIIQKIFSIKHFIYHYVSFILVYHIYLSIVYKVLSIDDLIVVQ